MSHELARRLREASSVNQQAQLLARLRDTNVHETPWAEMKDSGLAQAIVDAGIALQTLVNRSYHTRIAIVGLPFASTVSRFFHSTSRSRWCTPAPLLRRQRPLYLQRQVSRIVCESQVSAILQASTSDHTAFRDSIRERLVLPSRHQSTPPDPCVL